MVTLADKINRLLSDRGLMKRDLARALGVSPQTATDICKGRSAVTLPHLRRLIEFFGLRADYWMDDSRLEPTEADELIPRLNEKIQGLARTGLFDVDEPAALLERMVKLTLEHREEYTRMFGALSNEERRVLGLTGTGQGSVGRVQEGPGEQAAQG